MGVSAFIFVFSNWKACFIGLRSGDSLGKFFALKNSCVAYSKGHLEHISVTLVVSEYFRAWDEDFESSFCYSLLTSLISWPSASQSKDTVQNKHVWKFCLHLLPFHQWSQIQIGSSISFSSLNSIISSPSSFILWSFKAEIENDISCQFSYCLFHFVKKCVGSTVWVWIAHRVVWGGLIDATRKVKATFKITLDENEHTVIWLPCQRFTNLGPDHYLRGRPDALSPSYASLICVTVCGFLKSTCGENLMPLFWIMSKVNIR